MFDLTRKVCVVINARAESKRITNKMTRQFYYEDSLFSISIKKLLKSNVIPNYDVIVAYNENNSEFENIIDKIIKDVNSSFNVYRRTEESTQEEEDQSKIYEFYQHALALGYEYCVLVNPCCPLLRIETIDAFYSTFKYLDKDGLFGVLKKKNYFWNHDKRSINLPGRGEIMNTKNPNCTVYEAAHCLYGSKLSLIPEKKWMGGFTELGPELFIMPENETFDIDYEWQFKYGQILYKELCL